MADDDGEFDIAKWEPEKQEYGLFFLLVARTFMDEDFPCPEEMRTLKSSDAAAVERALAAEHSESEGEEPLIPEGEPWEETEAVAWNHKRGSWWRVHQSLGESVLIRSGVSLSSSEVRQLAPGDVVQQAGPPRLLTSGRAKGCIRLPVNPTGWVTADATAAGGPRYFIQASVPRWKVIYSSPSSSSTGDVLVRADPALDSEEVNMLYTGDIVEQAGPSLQIQDGIWRMPVFATVRCQDNDDNRGVAPRTYGWVTVDASAKGGPVFFKLVKDPDASRGRRRKHDGA